MSPSLSPGSVKSPRMRRSTGGKSRESEEESADTDQKIKLILEQAKQEAAQQAAAHHLVSMPGFSIPGGIPISAVSTQSPLLSPQSVVQVVSSPALDSRSAAAQSAASIRTGIPQPTVLPPRHEQQVRTPRMVAPVRQQPAVTAVVTGPRPPLPIQLPTQPLPPETVRKTQPVLLEQNQPAAKISQGVPRTTIAVSLPTEPVPRSVAIPVGGPVVSSVQRMPNSSTMASLTRVPISHPVSSAPRMPISTGAALVSSRPPQPQVVSSQLSITRHPAPTAPRPAPPSATRTVSASEGQRVSLKQREGLKDQEIDQKSREQIALEALVGAHQQQPAPLKREYLQPREQEPHRPSSTPLATLPEPAHSSKEEEKQAFSAQQQQYDAQTIEMYKMRNYQELSLIYNQLITAGHPEAVAINYAQSVMRERFMEEARPGSVPPLPLHHPLEEERREPLRQPLPAHSAGPYRQTDSPHFHRPNAHAGSQHPYHGHDNVGPPAAHMDYRREELVPPAAHSSQITRLTHTTSSIADFSTNRQGLSIQPVYNENSDNSAITNYSIPHLAAYPICWSGVLGLKNDMANLQMHYVSGCRDLARSYLPTNGSTLKIVQRMRLEDAQIDGVKKKMKIKSEHCVLLALPQGSDLDEFQKQSKILRNNFITYLQLKSAAGIVNVANDENQPAIVHVFPSCDFANENLAR